MNSKNDSKRIKKIEKQLKKLGYQNKMISLTIEENQDNETLTLTFYNY